ncbi:hypothetical protein [Spirosoma aerolatum]|uniref:hypothetical protein n=1 Tax=Spirosoma aerolatum TaxID=1211326 RepID=UPI0009AED23B|nr:hypothetical protein [Spirosoma aerolatum]
MRATRANLLSWLTATASIPFPRIVPDCRTSALVTYPGEETRFYMNLATPVAPNLGGPVVTLIEARNSGASASVTASLEIDSIALGQSCLFGTLTCPSVSPGLYRWKIVWGPSTWTSSLIEVLSQMDAEVQSIRTVLHHAKTLFGVRYPWLDSEFTCAFRVRMVQIGVPEFPTESSSYRESTTGEPINYNQASDKVLKFQVPYADSDHLEGIQWMLLHDSITFNGIPVRTRDFLTPSPGRSALAPAQFSVTDLSFAYPLIS